MYRTEPPTDKTIREWYMKFQQSGCLCAAKRRGRPGPMADARSESHQINMEVVYLFSVSSIMIC